MSLGRFAGLRGGLAPVIAKKSSKISSFETESENSGEGLSKKQAAQESTIRKLRAQIREMEEEKQRINSKLQVEETKSENIKKDKTATEKLLQETIEKYQTELAIQKEFYANELKLAKEAEALAELRANSEAQVELESRLKESGERESMLVQALEELRQALTRTEQQAGSKEELLQRDIDEIQKRYQETASRREETWRGVEKALNFRVQELKRERSARIELVKAHLVKLLWLPTKILLLI